MKISILGRNGLIGKGLWEEFPDAFNYLREDLDYVFWFAAPSSQFLFEYAPEYCKKETLQGFVNVLKFCHLNDIKLIYPSSATVYAKNNDYAKCKAKLEEMQIKSGYKKVLALRIFAGYGHEKHKGDYASVVYQFCKRMKEGKKPVIWGDGQQTRDFIFYKDIVKFIKENLDTNGVVDVGSGINTSFNDLIGIINDELGTNLSPVYVGAPRKYAEKTPCKNPVHIEYSVREGVREILKKL